MAQIQASTEIVNLQNPEERFRFIQLFLQNTADTVNGNLELSNNFLVPFKSVLFASANTDVTVNHGLGRVPRGYLIIGVNAASIIYDGAGEPTSTTIKLKASAACTAKILFL